MYFPTILLTLPQNKYIIALWKSMFMLITGKKRVAKTEEEAKKIFDQECHSQGDWFWDGDMPYDRYFEDENTYVLINDEVKSVVTLREVEI